MNEFAGNEARDHLPFAKHHAFIIGIDAYEKVSTLQTAVADAQRLAEVLSAQQHFAVYPPLLDAKGSDIRRLFQTMSEQVGKDDRVFFYFAGHGIAADGDDGPAGHIVPADAEPTDVKTFIPMADLQMALDRLPCRHLLMVLDCCFSGAFKWSSQSRDIGTLMPRRIYKERFDRFIADPAWQVITSAAYDRERSMCWKAKRRATVAAPARPTTRRIHHSRGLCSRPSPVPPMSKAHGKATASSPPPNCMPSSVTRLSPKPSKQANRSARRPVSSR